MGERNFSPVSVNLRRLTVVERCFPLQLLDSSLPDPAQLIISLISMAEWSYSHFRKFRCASFPGFGVIMNYFQREETKEEK